MTKVTDADAQRFIGLVDQFEQDVNKSTVAFNGGETETYTSNNGVEVPSYRKWLKDKEGDIANAEADKIAAQQAALEAQQQAGLAAQSASDAEATLSSAYKDAGEYAAGIEITERNQVVVDGDDRWVISAVTPLPYTTTGAGMPEGGAFVDVGDAVLRQELAASGGAGLIGYKGRSAADRLGDMLSVKDYGAVGDGGGTDNLAAVQAAIAAASGRVIYCPVDDAGGNYAITSGTLTIPNGQRFMYEGDARIYAVSPATIVDSGRHFSVLGQGNGGSSNRTRGIGIEILGDNSGDVSDLAVQYNRIRIRGDRLNGTSGGGTKVNGFSVDHAFGGGNAAGGRHGVEVALTQVGATTSTNADRNYVAFSASTQTSVGDGGSGPSPLIYQGSYFGVESLVQISGTAAYARNVTGMLTQPSILGGASARNREGLQITSKGTQRGIFKDAAISVSSGVSETTFKYGLFFNDDNGAVGLGADSAVIKISPSFTIDTVIDVEQVPMTHLFRTTESFFSDSTLRMRRNSASVALGTGGTSNTPNLTFFSGATAAPGWDARITASGGNGTDGNGNLSISAGVLSVSGILRPNSDNARALGGVANRWSVVYAGTGTINTSDEREKQQIRPISEAERDVAVRLKSLVRAFKFNDAVESKGDAARIHFGVIAQDVKAAFEAEGLVAEDYAVLCYDEWDETPEERDEEGNVVHEYRPAGNRYGVRYDQLLAFIITAL